jgi:oxygen-independent coproporphyrinogen-3 oxidase
VIHGLYVHIPFCAKRCHYCDFNTYEGLESLISAYVEALMKDMELHAKLAQAPGLQSVFFGGGTPSLLTPAQVASLISKASEVFGLCVGAEISLEANPGSVDEGKLRGYLGAGVTRLSLGAQALQGTHLRNLGRIHGASESDEAFRSARAAGFQNISLDLMFGLPDQTLDEWRASLDWVLSLDPEHLSFYGLTVEKGTRFHVLHAEGRLPLPTEEVQAQMYEWGISRLGSAGFKQYEISNFAKPGFASRHNQFYWKNLDTLGLGAGAWSFLSGRRYSRVRSPTDYVQGVGRGLIAEDESEYLPPDRARAEKAVLALRMMEGVDLQEWETSTGRPWEMDFGPQTKRFRQLGLLTLEGGRLRLSPQGLPLANEVFSALTVA